MKQSIWQGGWFAPIIGLLSGWLCWGMPFEIQCTVGITVWVALWWVLETVPIPVASMVPFVLFPLTGVLSNKEVATAYGHWLILLLMGGFMLSKMIEKSDLHQRLAITVMRTIGTDSPKRLLLGVMVSTAVLSAWISNTATTLMLLPIVLALGRFQSKDNLPILLLGLAYSASIGGMATPIGTPPNIVLIGVLEKSTGETIPFFDWMVLATPIATGMLLVTWWYLSRQLKPSTTEPQLPTSTPMTIPQKRVFMLFGLVVLLWIGRTQPFGGWSGLLPSSKIGDDTIALLGVVLAFVVPVEKNSPDRLLDWHSAKEIPWGLLLLFGGGIAIAKAFMASGLSELIGQKLLVIQHLPLMLMIGGLCLVVTFLTEVTSNTATTTLLMPILVSAAIVAGVDPKLWMVPAALSASCAFMLPVATAPNAIVFGSGEVTPQQMSTLGFRINLIGVVVITIGVLLLL